MITGIPSSERVQFWADMSGSVSGQPPIPFFFLFLEGACFSCIELHSGSSMKATLTPN